MKNGFRQAIRFLLISCLVGLFHLILVNVLFYSLKGWTAPLPEFLRMFFNPGTVGEGNDNWGYVLPFLTANVAANVVGYFVNRKATFRAENVPHYCLAIYLGVLAVLILLSTWLQGVLANLIIRGGSPFWATLAPTVAMITANTLQLAILFPLEKFVLFRDRSKPE
jgi:putative flippase GtrA